LTTRRPFESASVTVATPRAVPLLVRAPAGSAVGEFARGRRGNTIFWAPHEQVRRSYVATIFTTSIGKGQGGWRDDVLNYYPSDAGI
jgi:hypothetical protein